MFFTRSLDIILEEAYYHNGVQDIESTVYVY